MSMIRALPSPVAEVQWHVLSWRWIAADTTFETERQQERLDIGKSFGASTDTFARHCNIALPGNGNEAVVFEVLNG